MDVKRHTIYKDQRFNLHNVKKRSFLTFQQGLPVNNLTLSISVGIENYWISFIYNDSDTLI